MVKVFALLPRRADVTEDYFHEHWAGPHGELALRITTINRYVQSHRVAPGISGLSTAAYEGIAEVWFVDSATAAGMGDDPNYANYAHLDEPNFIDTENLAFMMTSEHVVRAGNPTDPTEGAVKAMLLLRRGSGQNPAGFAQEVSSLEYAVPGARRIAVATALPESYTDGAEPCYDAILELTFHSRDAVAAAQGEIEAIVDRLEDVIDRAESAGFLAEELRLIWPEEAAIGA